MGEGMMEGYDEDDDVDGAYDDEGDDVVKEDGVN